MISRYWTIPELRLSLDRGEFSAIELARATQSGLERVAPLYNGVAALLPQRSEAEAKGADTRRLAGLQAGPLDGIPYAAKDLFSAKGAATTWGSRFFRDQRLDMDAVVIARLTGAGGVLAAKASMVELAGAGRPASPGSSLQGQGRNPWDSSRYSGGSSSGSGILVALGLVPYAIGSETGGSTIGPAGYMGITGIRPTFGLIPRTGTMILSSMLDKVGVLARTAEDCASVMAVLAGPDNGDPDSDSQLIPHAHPSTEGLRVGIFKTDPDDWDADAASQLAAGLSEFVSIFQDRVDLDLPMGDMVNWALETIINTDTVDQFRDYIWRPDFELADSRQLATLRQAAQITAEQRATALEIRRQAVVAATELFDGVDAVVVATHTEIAPPLDRPRSGRRPTAADIMRAVANLAGLPGVSVPCGLTESGLPVGLHLIGPRGSDLLLLAIAGAYQQKTAHHLLRPPVG